MEYIIIKHYTNDTDGDYHDLSITPCEKIYGQMKAFARECGRQLFYTPISKAPCCGVPLDCTPFAEIEYTGELGKEERARYIEYLKKLSIDAKFNRGYLDEFGTLAMVRFRRIEDDIYEVKYSEKLKSILFS